MEVKVGGECISCVHVRAPQVANLEHGAYAGLVKDKRCKQGCEARGCSSWQEQSKPDKMFSPIAQLTPVLNGTHALESHKIARQTPTLLHTSEDM